MIIESNIIFGIKNKKLDNVKTIQCTNTCDIIFLDTINEYIKDDVKSILLRQYILERTFHSEKRELKQYIKESYNNLYNSILNKMSKYTSYLLIIYKTKINDNHIEYIDLNKEDFDKVNDLSKKNKLFYVRNRDGILISDCLNPIDYLDNDSITKNTNNIIASLLIINNFDININNIWSYNLLYTNEKEQILYYNIHIEQTEIIPISNDINTDISNINIINNDLYYKSINKYVEGILCNDKTKQFTYFWTALEILINKFNKLNKMDNNGMINKFSFLIENCNFNSIEKEEIIKIFKKININRNEILHEKVEINDKELVYELKLLYEKIIKQMLNKHLL